MTRLRIGQAVNPTSIDHGGLGGLDGDDHLQYLTEERADAHFEDEYLAGSATALKAWADALYAPSYTNPIKTVDVTVTTGQLLALNGTPKTLVAAPAAGKANVLLSATAFLDYATTAYDGIAEGEDLLIKYTNGSGTLLATIEATGFLDATADAVRYIQAATAAAITPVAEAALVLQMGSGNIATGDSPLKVRVVYREIDVAW